MLRSFIAFMLLTVLQQAQQRDATVISGIIDSHGSTQMRKTHMTAKSVNDTQEGKLVWAIVVGFLLKWSWSFLRVREYKFSNPRSRRGNDTTKLRIEETGEVRLAVGVKRR